MGKMIDYYLRQAEDNGGLLEIDGPILLECAECGAEQWLNTPALRNSLPSRWICITCIEAADGGK